MKFSRLQLTNIRSFQSADLVLSPKTTLIVGENNSGKSTLLQSLLAVQQPMIGPDSVRYGSPTGIIRVEMTDFQSSQFHSPVRNSIDGVHPAVDYLTVESRFDRTSGGALSVCQIQSTEVAWHNFPNEQPGNPLVPYLSTRRTNAFGENVGATYAYGVNTGHQFLYAKIDACASSRELREPFVAACKEVLGFEVTSWSSPNGKTAGLEVNARQRQHIPLTQMGAGVAHVVGLIVELLMADGKTYLIEELENDLHPAALRVLLQLVERSIANGSQFIVSTHSNHVVRYLGSIPETRIYHVARIKDSMPPESRLSAVSNEPAARRELLNSLGYELADYDLFSAWLVLEESSAEVIVREYLIPMFAPKLNGRIRIIGANGAGDVELRFADLHRLMTFVHLEPIYKRRAWVWCDGDVSGRAAIQKLRETFTAWPADHFLALEAEAFEDNYPKVFAEEVSRVLAIADRKERRAAKAALCERVKVWLDTDKVRAKEALAESAQPVIARLKVIEDTVSGARPSN
jgi:ABC-type transport system involved in cytochrome c biogenesis ATPase subunit